MAYLDGALAADRMAYAAAHLESCSDCQTVAADLQSVSHAMKSWGVETPAIVVDSSPIAKPRRWMNVLLPRPVLWVVGAAACLVLLASVMFRNSRKIEPTTHESRSMRVPANMDETSLHRQMIVKQSQALRTRTEEFVTPSASSPIAPMIARTADIAIGTREFDKARASMGTALNRHAGYVASLNISTPDSAGRTLDATLNVPSGELADALADLRKLGRVLQESQRGNEVTQQYVDLEARLANAQNTEQRLTDLSRREKGKLSDVLSVEVEITRVRGEIEQMEAERKKLAGQVQFASIHVTITEDYKAQMQVVPSASGRLRNAAVFGYRNVVETLIAFCEFLLSNGPGILLWAAILFYPSRLMWRRLHGASIAPSALP